MVEPLRVARDRYEGMKEQVSTSSNNNEVKFNKLIGMSQNASISAVHVLSVLRYNVTSYEGSVTQCIIISTLLFPRNCALFSYQFVSSRVLCVMCLVHKIFL